MNAGEPSTQPNDDNTRKENLVICLTGHETAALVDSVQTWRYGVDARQHGFFLAKKNPKGSFTVASEEYDDAERQQSKSPTTPGTPGDTLDYIWAIGALTDYETGFFDGVPLENRYICFADPSNYPIYPGWMLRNLLVLIRRRWNLENVRIICYRDVPARRDDAKSMILHLVLGATTSGVPSVQDLPSLSLSMPKATGWERNSAGKVMSKVANLGEYMDPQR